MKRGIAMVILFSLLLSLGGLWNSSQDVRAVRIVGLFGSGAVFGAALTFLIIALKAKREP